MACWNRYWSWTNTAGFKDRMGKIVLAEFTYGGRVAPSFPSWLIKGTRPSRLAWWLKAQLLPRLYWDGKLRGREWMAQPAISMREQGQ